MPTDETGSTASSERDGGRIEVLLVGTYHMDNPGLDTINIDADDVLEPTRQRELAELVDRLAHWQPDAVAVERPVKRQSDMDRIFERYQSGEVSYDEEVEIEPVHPHRESRTSECRSEVIQVGFRLADRLDHEQVHAVDYPMTMAANFDEEELAELDIDSQEMLEKARSRLAVDLTDPQRQKHKMETGLMESTITEYHLFLNSQDQLKFNHELMFGKSLAGEEKRYVGARILSAWYERNIRIVENLWRTAEADTERILLLIGNGHVKVLRHLLSEAPMFRPHGALSVLSED